jgi:hypothetical protein
VRRRRRRRPPRSAFPLSIDVVANPRGGRGIGTLGGTGRRHASRASAHLRRAAPGAWVLRLDADALVVGPVVERVEAAWRPGDGILGSCGRTCNGERRDLRAVRAAVRRHEAPVWVWRHPPRKPWWVRPADPFVRGVLRSARAAGYVPGSTASPRAARSRPRWSTRSLPGAGSRVPSAGSARAWATTWSWARWPRAAGCAARPARGLRPQARRAGRHAAAALDRGFGVVHSTKNDPAWDEAAIRGFFAAARA